MNTQLEMFGTGTPKGTGQQRKEAGIRRVANANGNFLAAVREEARRISREHGCVTSDDLRKGAKDVGLHPKHPNAWGAVFKETGWERLGTLQSTRPEAHGRWIQVWKWTGEQV